MIFLDTNVVIAVLNDPASPVRTRLDGAIGRGGGLALSSVVLFELQYGAAKSVWPEHNMRRIADFLTAPIDVVPFESDDAEVAGDIRADLERKGTPVGPYDVLIAAQARRHNALLVTANGREFSRVQGLKFEDWGLSGFHED
jgi:tRNA(fMet)-specific endonuclease VapC